MAHRPPRRLAPTHRPRAVTDLSDHSTPAPFSSGGAVVCRALCLGYAGLSLDELGGPDQLGGDGPGLGGRDGSPLLSRPHRVPEVEGETVVVLGDVDPERRGRLRLPRAEPRTTVLVVDVRVAQVRCVTALMAPRALPGAPLRVDGVRWNGAGWTCRPLTGLGSKSWVGGEADRDEALAS